MLQELNNYLNSLDWQEYIQSFVAVNCNKFKDHNDDNEFTHEQYSIWKVIHSFIHSLIYSFISHIYYLLLIIIIEFSRNS